jgi:hypothetical protein
MMDVVNVLNEFFKECLGFGILRQPNTSSCLKICERKRRILVDVWLCLHDVLDKTSPEQGFIGRYFTLLLDIRSEILLRGMTLTEGF